MSQHDIADYLADTARWLTEERDELLARARALAELQFHSAEVLDSALHLKLSGELVGILATAMAMHFKAERAENYIEMRFMDRETMEHFTVTAQRQKGQTPHQLRIQAERERDEERARLDWLESQHAVSINNLQGGGQSYIEADPAEVRQMAGSLREAIDAARAAGATE